MTYTENPKCVLLVTNKLLAALDEPLTLNRWTCNFKISIIGKGNCYGNTVAETLFKTIKAKLIRDKSKIVVQL
jgi:hypothetical protein